LFALLRTRRDVAAMAFENAQVRTDGWGLLSRAATLQAKETINYRMKKSHKKTFSRRKDPTQQRSRVTITRIIDATWDILGTDGAKAVTTRSIAARSGVTVGSIYQYFPHKEAILFELYKRRLAEVADTFEGLTSPELVALGPIEWDKVYTKTFDKLGWNQGTQLELDKACRLDRGFEKLLQKHFAKIENRLAWLYRNFYPEADDETIRVLSKFLYGVERLEAKLAQTETGRGRELVRSWRTEILHLFIAKFKK
jgi:AcrR family transcriptional regulator